MPPITEEAGIDLAIVASDSSEISEQTSKTSETKDQANCNYRSSIHQYFGVIEYCADAYETVKKEE